ncbi:hypothetical protein HT136_02675 [Novosphingobium profundi]|uniref:hypothetical protein n=1 Tax=Novosphingobium profundi TaxID=1774954 RepID=UPI001BDAB4DE|nr:hypothetical protein [Novosphingobium profundi]MBT0667271.1 hypothetical protein [Novosphingobium profundi]
MQGKGKGYFLNGRGQYTHEVVCLERRHPALACGEGVGRVLVGGSGLGEGPGVLGRDFLARLVETRGDSLCRNRIAVHIAGDCIGYLPPSLSTIYAEWAEDWRLIDTLILCRARVMIRTRPACRAKATAQVMLDIARPFQLRAFGS